MSDNEYKLETAPFDPRFPNQNVTHYCYHSYIEYHRCLKAKGDAAEQCNYYQKVFRSMCPNAWVARWDEQRENGTFPGKAENEMSSYKLETAPFDPRFPNQNVTRYCYQSYVDFHRCQKLRGDKYEPCQYFKKVYQSMCPNAWVEKWDEQRDNGTFPGKI